jgi:hypothetical protein
MAASRRIPDFLLEKPPWQAAPAARLGTSHKDFYLALCKTPLFHGVINNVFNSLWKSRWKIHRYAHNCGEFLWETGWFSTTLSR